MGFGADGRELFLAVIAGGRRRVPGLSLPQEAGFLRHGERHSFDDAAEALQAGARLVRAGRQSGDREVAAAVGDGRARQSGIDVLDDDVDAGQYALRLILDGAGDRR